MAACRTYAFLFRKAGVVHTFALGQVRQSFRKPLIFSLSKCTEAFHVGREAQFVDVNIPHFGDAQRAAYLIILSAPPPGSPRPLKVLIIWCFTKSPGSMTC